MALAELGYDPGPPDGVMGSRTRKAYATYAQSRRLAGGGLTKEGLQRLRADRLGASGK
jgi:peptidoglycan hydrolase-like protein with peptidoglycan-binding domain